ncbi:hypothetical protein H9P43_004186 [Blastocladiella emersonii ATCC 22665]|nr:hypothetical protein H9P43_004186 [Blastocladiella emersonii ATCC 22665]
MEYPASRPHLMRLPPASLPGGGVPAGVPLPLPPAPMTALPASIPMPVVPRPATAPTVAAPAPAPGPPPAAPPAPAATARADPSLDYLPNPLFATFTKSRVWAQKLVEELSDLVIILTPQGNIVFASASSRNVVGFASDEMVQHHVSEFLHPDDARAMGLAVAAAARAGDPFQLVHRYRRKNADYVILEIHGRRMDAFVPRTDLPAAAAHDRARRDPTLIVAVGREYPGKLSPFLDSVLDLKIEHERLVVRKREMEAAMAVRAAGQSATRRRRTTQNGTRAPTSSLANSLVLGGGNTAMDEDSRDARSESNSSGLDENSSNTGSSVADSSNGNGTHNVLGRPMPSVPAMPIGLTPSTMGIFGPPATQPAGPNAPAGTRADESGDGRWYSSFAGNGPVPAGGVPDTGSGSGDANGGGAAPAASGETTGAAAAAGNGGGGDPDASAVDAILQRKRKRRTVKQPQERVCIDCGTTQSPEWRKGPTGAKTLCNACGLRYAKKVKTEQQMAKDAAAAAMGSGSAAAGGPAPPAP